MAKRNPQKKTILRLKFESEDGFRVNAQLNMWISIWRTTRMKLKKFQSIIMKTARKLNNLFCETDFLYKIMN